MQKSAEIQWSIRAVRQLRKLERPDQERIREAVSSLAHMPAVANVRRLAAHHDQFRMRIRNFRVIFRFDGAARVIYIEEVLKRDEHTY